MFSNSGLKACTCATHVPLSQGKAVWLSRWKYKCNVDYTSPMRPPLKYAWPSFQTSGNPSVNSSDNSSTNSTRWGTEVPLLTEINHGIKSVKVAYYSFSET